VSDKLERLGLAAVEVLPYDTCADDRHFFSYRRACLRGEKDYGRGLSAIALTD
jgi:polyphenol oxidase